MFGELRLEGTVKESLTVQNGRGLFGFGGLRSKLTTENGRTQSTASNL
jgi:hypothetical protein